MFQGKQAFMCQLSRLQESSPEAYAGALSALRAADQEPTFAEARFETMGGLPGLVLSFRLGPCQLDRFLCHSDLSHSLAPKWWPVVDTVRELERQRLRHTLGTPDAISTTTQSNPLRNQGR